MRHTTTDSTDRVDDQPETTGTPVAPMTAELLGDVDELGQLGVPLRNVSPGAK